MAELAPELYEAQYKAARNLFEADLEGCIATAKKNLLDPFLPPHYRVMNFVLIVSALDDWDEAEMWRLSAELVYDETLADATSSQDQELLDVLVDLREELDALIRFKDENMFELHGFGVEVGFDGSSARPFWEEDDDYELHVRPASALQNPTPAEAVEATPPIKVTPSTITAPTVTAFSLRR